MAREDSVAKLMAELKKGWLNLEEVRERFNLKSFNAETEAAMLEAEQIAGNTNVKGYTDINELFAALKE